MRSVPTDLPAADRARLLAELSETLNEVHHLLFGGQWWFDHRLEASELYLRIEAARLEVQALRLSRSINPRSENTPEWTDLPPWDRGDRELA